MLHRSTRKGQMVSADGSDDILAARMVQMRRCR